MLQRNGLILGLGALSLGLIGLIFGDYALQWEPVPASWPAHDLGAYVSAAVLVLAGLAVIWRRSAVIGAQVLAAFFALWVVALHLPPAVAAPTSAAAWLGAAEISALACGAVLLALTSGPAPDVRFIRAARILFGLCCLVFGLCHFVYAQFTADMVPGWIPFPLFWAYATGAGHVAAGVAILSGVRARLAAAALTGMFASFVVLLHIPRVFGAPTSHLEWTMTAIALSLTGAAFVVWRSSRT